MAVLQLVHYSLQDQAMAAAEHAITRYEGSWERA